jgi:NADPH:quinone reductase-like Zn-dependent oxidoreductase
MVHLVAGADGVRAPSSGWAVSTKQLLLHPPDALELNDIDQPVVSDDAVLVRVHAAAVGKGDWLTVFDVAGRIEAVGSNVTRLQPGDEVFGWCDGSFAEYASVPEDQLVLKPGQPQL